MSEPTTPVSQPTPTPSKPRRFLKRLRFAALLAILAGVAQTEPRIFKFTVASLIHLEAWRGGYEVKLGRVESTVFDPLEISGIELEKHSQNGLTLRLVAERAQAVFGFKTILGGSFDRWFSRLTLTGLQGRVFLPTATEPAPQAAPPLLPVLSSQPFSWLPLPETFELRKCDFVVENGAHSIEVADAHGDISVLEPGRILAGRVTVRQPWLERSFRAVQGTTALQGSKLLLGNVRLEPEIEIRSFSADLLHLAGVEPEMEVAVDAFGGALRGQARVLSNQGAWTLDGSGTFDQIDLAKLATFFKLSDASGGIIRAGKFTFRGSPQDLGRSTASVLLEASNFQWESRQWDSLALGASLMDRSLRISKLNLRQGRNRLDLSGVMTLPTKGVAWWQDEFTCDLSAEIDDLTALSALLLPEFKFAAGKVKLDGSIRGRNQNFTGQLIASGSQLKWRNAPVENLHAAVKLSGNEFQILNLELFNGADYLRGHGGLNILGPSQYWGEFRASIDELSLYAALLQKPILPEPLAGGAVVEWTGEGSQKGSTGKFLAKLNKVRSAVPSGPQPHPVNLTVEGAYSKGGAQLSKFLLSNDNSQFTADIALGDHALSIKDLRVLHADKLALEGSALLPFDVWQGWPNTSLAQLLNGDTVSDVSLNAHGLDLDRASQLLGLRSPFGGLLNGSFKASGPSSAFRTQGDLALSKGTLPLTASGAPLEEVEAQIHLQDAEIQLKSFTGRHRLGKFTMEGGLNVANLLAPQITLKTSVPNAEVPLFGMQSVLAKGAIDLSLDGTPAKLRLSGTGTLAAVEFKAPPELGRLWAPLKPQEPALQLPPLFGRVPAVWSKCELSIALANGTTTPTGVQIGSTLEKPSIEGSFVSGPFPATVNGRPLRVNSAALSFSGAAPAAPVVVLNAVGQMNGDSFQASVAGPLNHLSHWTFSPLGTSEEEIEESLGGGLQRDAGAWSFLLDPPAPPKSPAPPAPPAASKGAPPAPAPKKP
jgi:hypothetical protein